jgi:hypothetical protein
VRHEAPNRDHVLAPDEEGGHRSPQTTLFNLPTRRCGGQRCRQYRKRQDQG